MVKFESNREKNIENIITVVRLSSLLLCGIIVLQHLFLKMDKVPVFSERWFDDLPLTLTLIPLMTAIYLVWSMLIKKRSGNTRISDNMHLAIESAFFMITFTAMIIISGAHTSQYKFLFLFIIITDTIQAGIKQGIVVASLSSVIIFGIDLIYFKSSGVNPYFENDFILAGVFMLTAWPLGFYVKVEDENRKRLVHLANVDGLTNVYNHRYFQEKLRETMGAARRSNFPMCLIILDIDYFKHYNDLFGHQKGDYLLKKLGTILIQNVRESDTVARYGGEEFTIILPFTSRDKAVLIAERIRKAVEDAEFDGRETQPNGKVTVSIGVASFPENAGSEYELIKSADDALYRAKFFNKNRVEAYYSVLEDIKKDTGEEHIEIIHSIKTLIDAINKKDRYTYSHVERVVMLTRLIGKELGLSEGDKKLLKYGAYLHDIGKINVSQEILLKKDPLTDEEWESLKEHPINGVNIIRSVDSLKEIIPIILYHHERYDGRGYPNGLAGDAIPYLARVLTVVDSFDAMTSNRPYREKKSYEEGLLELERNSGTQFDPEIVRVFIEVIKRNKGKFNEFE